MADSSDSIFVFDSGMGGISVLRELVKQMPKEDFYYFGDSKNAPYGTRTKEEVQELTLSHVKKALDHHCKAVAIACNTATTAAVSKLRELYPDLPLVGIEPALKPAAEAFPGEDIVVMATPMTIREEKFHRLLDRYKDMANIDALPCPGLMEYVEEGRLEDPSLEPFLMDLLSKHLANPPKAVVLGCTHYPFVKNHVQNILGDSVAIFDGSEGTARELKRRITEAGLLRTDDHEGNVTFQTSAGGREKIDLCHKLLNLNI